LRVHSVADVAAAVRGRRLDNGLSQSELARRSGVSRKWVSEFEAGKTTAEFALVLRVLEELRMTIDLSEGADAPLMTGTGTSSVIANVPAPDNSPSNLDELLERHRK
jgi:HTH-type transcriptional regulator / antitoxin HipB